MLVQVAAGGECYVAGRNDDVIMCRVYFAEGSRRSGAVGIVAMPPHVRVVQPHVSGLRGRRSEVDPARTRWIRGKLIVMSLQNYYNCTMWISNLTNNISRDRLEPCQLNVNFAKQVKMAAT